MRQGKVKLNEKELNQALGLATALDMSKDLLRTEESQLAVMRAMAVGREELNAQSLQYSRALDSLTMSGADREKMAGLNQIDDRYLQQMRRLQEARRETELRTSMDPEAKRRSLAQYDAELAIIREFHAEAAMSFEQYWARLRTMQEDWTVGASSALANYLESSRNVSAQADALGTKIFSGWEDAITSLTMSGKADFKSLANSIIADLVRMQVRAQIANAAGGDGWLGKILGSFGIGASRGLGSATAADVAAAGDGLMFFDSGGYTGPGGRYDPAGIVHRGEVVFSQDDVSRHGGVAAVEAMRRGGRGYADGGVVGMAPYAASPAADMPGGRVIVHNYAGAQVETRQQPSAGGGVDTVLLIREVSKAIASDIADGVGPMMPAIQDRLGYNR